MKKILLFALALLSSVSFADERMPDWVMQPSRAYPSERYLAAVGEGKTKKQAENQAVSQIASFFSQNVNSRSEASRALSQDNRGGRATVTEKSDFTEKIDREVLLDDLAGVEIADSFFDGGVFYALAVLDRRNAAQTYSQYVRENNAKIQSLVDDDGASDIERVAIYGKAEKIAAETEKWLRYLSVLDVEKSRALRAESFSATELQKAKRKIAAKIPISVEASGEFAARVAAACEDAILSCGFKCSSAASAFVLRLSVSTERRSTADKEFVFCLYNVIGGLYDEENGGRIFAVNESGRTNGDLDWDFARDKAQKNVEAIVRKTVAEKLNSEI